MSVYQTKDGIWHVAIQRSGARAHRRCERGATKKDAKAYEAQLRQELAGLTRRKTIATEIIATQPEEASAWERSIMDATKDKKSWLWLSCSNLKARHKRRGYIGQAIDVEQLGALFLTCKGRCSVSGIRLKLPGNGKVSPETASVDRIDPTHGYVPANCRIVAYCVNVAMNNWGEEFFKKICYGIVAREYF